MPVAQEEFGDCLLGGHAGTAYSYWSRGPSNAARRGPDALIALPVVSDLRGCNFLARAVGTWSSACERRPHILTWIETARSIYYRLSTKRNSRCRRPSLWCTMTRGHANWRLARCARPAFRQLGSMI